MSKQLVYNQVLMMFFFFLTENNSAIMVDKSELCGLNVLHPHPPKKILCWNHPSKVMVLDGKDFGISLHYEDRSLLTEIGAFIKETKKSSLPLWWCDDTASSMNQKVGP